jgi:hypothetical protein
MNFKLFSLHLPGRIQGYPKNRSQDTGFQTKSRIPIPRIRSRSGDHSTIRSAQVWKFLLKYFATALHNSYDSYMYVQCVRSYPDGDPSKLNFIPYAPDPAPKVHIVEYGAPCECCQVRLHHPFNPLFPY